MPKNVATPGLPNGDPFAASYGFLDAVNHTERCPKTRFMDFPNQLVFLMSAAAIDVAASPGLCAQYYTATKLSSSQSEGNAVNNSGLVVGYNSDSQSQIYPYRDIGGAMSNLGTFGGSGAASDVNDSGLIVGGSSYANGAQVAFSYSAGVITNLGFMGGIGSGAIGVNNSGLIVGAITASTGAIHAFSYIGGTTTDLGTLGGNVSVAAKVNDSGLIVGYSETAGGAFDAFSDIGGVMTDLGFQGIARDVNNFGLIVGESKYGAFSDFGGAITNLGSLGGSGADAVGVNDSGLIVGDSAIATGGDAAFSYIGGVMTDLNYVTSSLGTDLVSLITAFDVNNNGQIVGIGLDRSGKYVAYILNPTDIAPTQTLSDKVPEISNSSLLVFIGMAGMAVAGRIGKRVLYR